MTRINCGIEPCELSDKHLLAEHREIKRIPNCIKKGKYNLDNIPENFKLGTGHVKFFYNKLAYLAARYTKIYNECVLRGFNITEYFGAFTETPLNLWGKYTSTQEDRKIVLERLLEKDFEFYKNLK